MVLAYDFLDVMAWDVSVSAFLLCMGAIMLRYKSSTGLVEENAGGSLRRGFEVAAGASGFYLFISGLAITFIWPFALSSGVYNVLFGGIAILGGLLLLTSAIILYLNVNLKPVSYFAAVAGVYAFVNAYSMLKFSLTSSPLLSALGYMTFAAPALLSVPATHLLNKWWKWLFVIFSLLFAVAWLYQAANFTYLHLNPS
jgi:putative membrane protein